MRVIITGGLGFVGKLLCGAVLQTGQLTGPSGVQTVDDIVLFDVPGKCAPSCPY